MPSHEPPSSTPHGPVPGAEEELGVGSKLGPVHLTSRLRKLTAGRWGMEGGQGRRDVRCSRV